MYLIKDLFDPNVFCIKNIVLEHNSPSREFIVKVHNFEYLMSFHEMQRLCYKLNIDFNKEYQNPHYQRFTYDNRSMSRKLIDVQIGKPVDFSMRSLHISSITSDRVFHQIESQIKISKDDTDLEK